MASAKELSDFLKSSEKRAFKQVLYAVRDEDAALDIVQDAMIKLSQSYGDKNIEDSIIPLAIITTNIINGKKVALTKGSLAKAVMASTCIPGIFKPIEMDDMMLVDGGIVENVIDMAANPLLQLDKDGVEVLLPIFDGLVQKVQRKKKELHVKAPEGLIDLYLG